MSKYKINPADLEDKRYMYKKKRNEIKAKINTFTHEIMEASSTKKAM